MRACEQRKELAASRRMKCRLPSEFSPAKKLQCKAFMSFLVTHTDRFFCRRRRNQRENKELRCVAGILEIRLTATLSWVFILENLGKQGICAFANTKQRKIGQFELVTYDFFAIWKPPPARCQRECRGFTLHPLCLLAADSV